MDTVTQMTNADLQRSLPFLLMFLAVGLFLFLIRSEYGPEAQFNPFVLPALAWYGLGLLLALFPLALGTEPRLGWRRSLLLLSQLLPVGLVALYLSRGATSLTATAILSCALAIAALLLLASCRALSGRPQRKMVAAAVSIMGVFGGVALAFDLYEDPWYELIDEPLTSEPLAVEQLLYSQPARVEAALKRLGPRELGPSAYFLGFAGYAEEKVFTEEIRFAARIIDARYGTGPRTLFLLNDQRNRQRQPIASVSTLGQALLGLGRQMNTEDDLLVLALSSHGSADAALAVSNGDLPLGDLDASTLRQRLDEAGVRWRLILISACYAGSFLPQLATPESIVITAAAPDRTSFGCSNDRDLTYFGEAFLRDALPGAESLEAAFEQARRLVTEREAQIGVQASSPVAHFGVALSERLRNGTYDFSH